MLLMAFAASGHAATLDDVIFRATFDDTVEANIARGRSAPKAITGEPRFDAGRFGRALVAGEAGAVPEYRIEDNLDVTQGSLSMWVLPVNWRPAEPRSHVLLRFPHACIFRIFTSERGTLVFEVGTDMAERCRVEASLDNYPQNQWLHIVATWSAEQLLLYLNGRLVGEQPCDARFLPPVVNYNFQVGDLPRARGRESERITLIDDLTIYRRPIGPDELQRIDTDALRTVDLDAPPHVDVIAARDPVQIDGRLDDDAWRHAPALGQFQDVATQQLASLPTTARFAFDDSHLYFSIESPILPGTTLRRDAQQRDDAVWNDDALQLYLSPPGDLRYHMVVNADGVIFDRQTTVGIDNDPSWDGPWQIANNTDGGIWRVEGAIAFDALDLTPPADGETWRVNVTRDRVDPKSLSCWANVSSYADVAQHGTVRFRQAGPSICVSQFTATADNMVNIAGVADAGLIAQLKATRGGAMVIDKSVAIDNGILQLREPWRGDAPDTLQLHLVDQAGDTCFRQTVHLGSIAGLTIDALPIPSRGICKVSLQQQNPALRAAATRAIVELFGAHDDTPIRRVEIPSLSGGMGSGTFDIAALPAGQYTLRAAVYASGQRIDEASVPLNKPPTPWQDAHVGIAATPPPPWTPMRAQQFNDGMLRVECWNRTHDFVGPLPARIDNGDLQQLTGAAQLRIAANGRTLPWHGVTIDDVRADDTAVNFASRMTAGAIDVKADTRIEYDGMMWMSITLTPRRPTTVDAIDVEIPIDVRYATLRHTPGDILLTGNTGREDGWTWTYAARRFYMWLGNEDLGLTWFYERPDQLRFADPDKFVQLHRDGDTMRFTARYVAEPITLNEPLTLEFGLQATPVRSRPDGWRSWGSPRPIGHGVTIPWTTEHIDRYAAGYPEATSPAFYSRFVEHMKRYGEVVPYKIMLWHGIETPQWGWFQADWDLGGGVNKYSDTRRFWWGARICGAADSFIDFITWKMIGHIEQHQLDGTYHDLQWSSRCTNPYHGCAPGSRRAILGDRELNKRLYTAMQQLGRPVWKIDHPSSRTSSTFSGFSDICVTGEELIASSEPDESSYRVWDDYFDAMRISYFKAGGAMGRQWGVVPMLLLQMRSAPPGATEGIYSILLAHDAIPTWGAHARDVRYEHRLWRTLEAFGIGDDDVTFLPYWHDDTPAKVVDFAPDGGGPIRPAQVRYETEPFDRLREDESYGVSIYHRPGKRSLVVLFNFTDDDATATLRIDAAALGYNASLAAADAFAPLDWVAADGDLAVRVKRRNCRLIWVQPRAATIDGADLPNEPIETMVAGIRPDEPHQLRGITQQVVGDITENPWQTDAPQRTDIAQPFTLDRPAAVHRFEIHMTYNGTRGTMMREAAQAQLVRLDDNGRPGEVIVDIDGFVPQEVRDESIYYHYDMRRAARLEPGRYALLLSKPAETPGEYFHAAVTATEAFVPASSVLMRESNGPWQSRPRTAVMGVFGYAH